jgi:hypothetical protein
MELINTRIARDNESTLGLLTVDDRMFSFVIEDEKRDVKVKDETRISAGLYPIQFRKELTPLTKKYRAKYSWFTYHLELQNVPDFTNVYIHIGNFESSTAACQVVGNKAGFDTNNHFRNFESTDNFKRLYLLISDALNRGEKVSYEIIDRD